ncbi:MAG: MFS transporter [Caldilineaceae bacterium]
MDFLRHFDWLGVLYLAAAVTFLVFFISSRPITGVEPLHDWRLLGLSVGAGVLFVLRERRHADPFLSLDLFRVPSLRWASIGSGLRMFTMSGIGFLMPLYLADVHNLSAAMIGAFIMTNAAALLVTMRAGGQMADRWGSRLPVMIGLSVQSACMLYFALLPADVPLAFVVGGLLCHGLGAGLSLAAFHRASMSQIRQEQSGSGRRHLA